MKSLFFLIVVVAVAAHAGVRVVGKGGGYAEMQALFINLKLHTLARPCVNNPNLCSLTAQQAQELSRASATGFELELDPSCATPPMQMISAQKAIVSSCELYTPETSGRSPQVKTFGEIAGVVLTARLMATSQLNLAAAQKISQLVFKDYTQNESSLFVNLDAGNFVVHRLEFQSGVVPKQILFSLEGAIQTVDITPAILEATSCPPNQLTLKTLEIQNAMALSSDQGVVQSDIQWTCTDHREWKGNLQVFFTVSQGEILEDSAKVKISGKRPH